MRKQKILALVGGISRNSINKKLFNAIKNVAPENMEISEFDISSLPFFSQDIENDPPPTVRDLKSRVDIADGILIVTPEYNRSIPGVLKNAIDWASRPYGQSVWKKKRAAILGVSPGKAGTTSAQLHLRTILMAVNVLVMPQPEVYLVLSETLNGQGDFASDKTQEYIKKYLGSFLEFIGSEFIGT